MRTLELFNYLKMLEDARNGEDHLYLKAQWIRYYMHRHEGATARIHPFYTLHDHIHFDAVTEYAQKIAFNAGLFQPLNSLSLSYRETFYLLASVYLHDIGMFIHNADDEEEARFQNISVGEIIRNHHHFRSADFVRNDGKKLFLLDNQEADIIALLCKGHRLNLLEYEDDFRDRSDSNGDPVRVRLLAGLLQAADELDMSHRRAPGAERGLIDKLPEFNPESKFHWMKHYYTESVGFRTEIDAQGFKTILVDISLLVPDIRHQEYMQKKISERLHNHIDRQDFRKYGFAIKQGRLRTKLDEGLQKHLLRPEEIDVLYIGGSEVFAKSVGAALIAHQLSNFTYVIDVQGAFTRVAKDKQRPPEIVILHLDEESVENEDQLNMLIALKNMAQQTIFRVIVTNDAVRDMARKSGFRVLLIDATAANTAATTADRIYDAIKFSYTIDDEKSEAIMHNKPYLLQEYRILIVEDLTEDYNALKQALEDQQRPNLQIAWAAGIKQAKEMLAANHYEAVVLDRLLPMDSDYPNDFGDGNVTGLTLLELVADKYKATTRMMMSSIPTAQAIKAASEIGMFDFMDKPPVNNWSQIAQRTLEMLDDRKRNVIMRSQLVVEADLMYFSTKRGKVIKTVTRDTGDEAGIVEIDGEQWRATTFKTRHADRSLLPGTEVIAFGIIDSCIQVEAK